jgi:HEAT repeat protein
LSNVHASVSASLSDSLTREVYLLENVAIQGRKIELRQLLKLLNLAKTGQPKAALITGDAGIGKTALLQTFVTLVREGVYCRVVDLGQMRFSTPETLYCGIVSALRQEADQVLEEALMAVNELTRELDLRWERTDLVRAVGLVKLQESIGGKDTVNQEQLLKAIRSQVPAIKKLKLSVSDKVEKLVDLLMNPWVTIATSILHPSTAPLQEALRLSERLQAGESCDEILASFAPSPSPPAPAPIPVIDLTATPSPVASSAAASGRMRAAAAESSRHVPESKVPFSRGLDDLPFEPNLLALGEGIVSAPRPVRRKTMSADEEGHSQASAEGTENLDRDLNPAIGSGSHKELSTGHAAEEARQAKQDLLDLTRTPVPVFSPDSLSAPGSGWKSQKPGGHKLLRPLMAIFDSINQIIGSVDTGLLLVLDEWERIGGLEAALEDRQALKAFFADWLVQLTERKNSHFMLVMTARTENESYTVGGTIYNQFRTKLLLDPLNENVCRKWARTTFQGLELTDSVQEKLFALSEGHPYWQLKLHHYIKERVSSNRVSIIDDAFFEKLGIETVEDIPELAFTRLKLMFLNDEDTLFKAIAALINRFGETSFSATQAIRELCASQGFQESYVFEVLRALFWHDFIRPLDKNGAKSGAADPVYRIANRRDLEFLQEKTRSIEAEISTEEKLTYLKRIIPLSIQSGDLDREKTMEILSLGDAMGHPEIVTFLEELFLDALHDEQAMVRVTALNNIALIDSPRSRSALFAAMRDEHSMVREYAAKNLEILSERELSRKHGSPVLAEQIIETMLNGLDDESELVRSRIYSVLSQCRHHRDLSSVFLKGLSDSCQSVRVLSTRTLAETPVESPQVFTGLLDAVTDPAPEVRRYACLGLQKYPISEAIEAIVRVLKQDENPALRALAADSLSHMEDSRAFPALVTALRSAENTEDVKLAVVRALGKRQDPQTEAVLVEALMQANSEAMPVFVWASVRSLGQVGGSPRALDLLSELRHRVGNPIILSAMDMAQRKIQERLNEMDLRTRQMTEEPSVMVMLSTIQEELPSLEEDILPSIQV